VDSWFTQYGDIETKIHNEVEKEMKTLENNPEARFSVLKRRLSRISDILCSDTATNLAPSTIRELANLVTTDKNFDDQLSRITAGASRQSQSGYLYSIAAGVATGVTSVLPSFGRSRASRKSVDNSIKSSTTNAINVLPQQDDFAFAAALQSMAENDPNFKDVVEDFKVLMVELLRQKISRLSSSIPIKIKENVQASIDTDIGQLFEQKRQQEETLAFQSLKEKVQEYLSTPGAKPNDG